MGRKGEKGEKASFGSFFKGRKVRKKKDFTNLLVKRFSPILERNISKTLGFK